jgi:hypothetical protein
LWFRFVVAMGNVGSVAGGGQVKERLVWLELYDQETYDVPQPRNSQGSCSHNGSLYIFGGVRNKKKKKTQQKLLSFTMLLAFSGRAAE